MASASSVTRITRFFMAWAMPTSLPPLKAGGSEVAFGAAVQHRAAPVQGDTVGRTQGDPGVGDLCITEIHKLGVHPDASGSPGVWAVLAQIMQRGNRLDEQKTGAGLGLPIAQRLLEAYDATLLIENVPGGGVRLTVQIPRPW